MFTEAQLMAAGYKLEWTGAMLPSGSGKCAMVLTITTPESRQFRWAALCGERKDADTMLLACDYLLTMASSSRDRHGRLKLRLLEPA